MYNSKVMTPQERTIARLKTEFPEMYEVWLKKGLIKEENNNNNKK